MDTKGEIIQKNVAIVRERIAEAEYKAGRPQGCVRLVGVTKFVEKERIAPALLAGITETGENRAQEFVDKNDFFDEYGVKKHFIGTLQSNKVKYLVGKADLIQSVDRPQLLTLINRLAQKAGIEQDILIEVNIGHEEQKAGIIPETLPELFKIIPTFPNIRLKGLMCVPPQGTAEETRPYFARMRDIFMKMKETELPNVSMEILSMGMSGDYTAAIEEGSTMVRVGSAIFGARPPMRRPAAPTV